MIVLIILSPIILFITGFAWGFVWISAIHAVPYFFVISPIVDFIVYWYVGTKLHHQLTASSLSRGFQIPLGVIGIAIFYTGNRVILFGWILDLWPYQGNEIFWLLVAWDMLSMITGLSAATGLAAWITPSVREHWATVRATWSRVIRTIP